GGGPWPPESQSWAWAAATRTSSAVRASDDVRVIISLGLPSAGGPGFARPRAPSPYPFIWQFSPLLRRSRFMRVSTVAIVLAGGAVLAAACFRVKSAAARRKDVLACSAIHPQAPEMALCLETDHSWPTSDAE